MKRQKSSHERLISICLIPDSYVPEFPRSSLSKIGKVIGSLYIALDGTTCNDLRKFMEKYPDFPKDFRFLTKNGWPFDASIEDKILIVDCLSSDVITIQAQHKNLQRIGIKLLNGNVLGFVFLDFACDISHLRNTIMNELNEDFESAESFEFVDNNMWPIRRKQESQLSLWDLVVDNCITIVKRNTKYHIESEDKTDKRPKFDPLGNRSPYSSKEEHFPFQKSILISYVHGEAESCAKDLKKELLHLGFKDIFLDVDDIPPGQDWQDVLGLAVNNCSIFIPLVTPRYGETRWTGREAKLADEKEKLIIPISFLESWPPDSLAIQFLTLQYIPWKNSDEDINGQDSYESKWYDWGKKDVQRVAKEIQKRCSIEDVSSVDSASAIAETIRIPERLSLNLRETHLPGYPKQIGKRNLIVISAHCKQKDFVDKVTEKLTCVGYDVWCSMEMCECDEITFSPIEDSQPVIESPMEECNGSFPYSCGEIGNEDLNGEWSNVKSMKKEFKKKVKEAKIVILVVSCDYMSSRICNQQFFYCRERTSIVIKYGDFKFYSMQYAMYPEHDILPSENWEPLIFKIEEKLKFDSEFISPHSSNIMLSACQLKNVINIQRTVYIFGGTTNVSNEAVSFSMTLGTELAKVQNLCIATEGFIGVGDLVGKNFCEEQQIRNKYDPPNVLHILPVKDSADYSNKAKQTPEGLFSKLPYGKTLYFGNSVSNRDAIVAAAFRLCILIEGGERSASLAEKFLWNDCIVIPVLYRNNAFSHKKCLSESINYIPTGVEKQDWDNLRLKCSAEEKARSVKRIVCSYLKL